MKKKREVQVDYFNIIDEGWHKKYSITFTPNGDKLSYQIMNEQTTRIAHKGEYDG